MTDTKEKIGDAATGDKDAAKEILTEAKDKAGAAVGRAYEKVSDQASSKINEQKSNLAAGLSTVAENLREVDKNLQNTDQETPITNFTGKYTGSLADQIENLAGYLDNKELGEMLGDVEKFARKNPTVFIGGAFAAGLLLARFLKSSNSRRNVSQYLKDDTSDSSGRRRKQNESITSGRQDKSGTNPSKV